jgi:hypothetical protein
MPRIAILLAAVALVSLAGPASAEEIMSFAGTCKRGKVSNADYRNCRSERVEAAAKAVRGPTGRTPVDGGTLFVLAPKGEAFAGGGYEVSILIGPAAGKVVGHLPSGFGMTVRDPAGRVSVFESCGTCTELDHVRGPLKAAAIQRLWKRKAFALGIPGRG